MAQVLSDRQKKNTYISRCEEHAFEDWETHWMHVDWMTAMTSGAICHYMLQLRCCSATGLEDKDLEITDLTL